MVECPRADGQDMRQSHVQTFPGELGDYMQSQKRH